MIVASLGPYAAISGHDHETPGFSGWRWHWPLPVCVNHCGGTEEVMVMMIWFGSHWAFWQTGQMWIAVLVFWGPGGLGRLCLHYPRPAPDAQPRRRR